MIELEDGYSDAAFWGERDNAGVFKGKVVVPKLSARIEEEGEFASFWVEGAQVTAFVLVAAGAGQCQIDGPGLTTVLPGYHVVNLVGVESDPGWQ